jgi:acetylornithine/succinyldiaminopimelate/putrescine aminotransferase
LLKKQAKTKRFSYMGFNYVNCNNLTNKIQVKSKDLHEDYLLHHNSESNSIKQKLASYVRTQETYEIEIDNFNKEISSLDNYHGKELVTLGTSKVKYIHKVGDF